MEKNTLIENIRQLSEQIKLDDIEENPASAFEQFQCDCCGKVTVLAGSLPYGSYRLCNDCVMLAELEFASEKITDIQELIDKMEDNRFDSVYDLLFSLDENSLN